jgi:phage protein D
MPGSLIDDVTFAVQAHPRSVRARSATGHSTPAATVQPADGDRLTKTLQAATQPQGGAAALRDRAEKAEVRADQAEAEVAAERARTAKAEAEREQARVPAAAAEGEAKGLRLALEEARLPFWRRWLG